MSSEQREELNWNAFRYVAGEMTADEAGAFEGRLADDPNACEAVCRAVGLGQLLAAALADRHEPVPFRSGYPTRRGKAHFARRAAHALGWMMVGAVAASFAFWLARAPSTISDKPLPQPPVKTEVVQPNLQDRASEALTWTRLRARGEWTAQGQRWQPESGSALALEASDLWRASSPPSWLLTPPSSNKGEKP